MGYTHYWERKPELPLQQFTAAVEDCRRVCAALPIPLGDAHGQGEPLFTAKKICFNGHVDSGRLSSIQKSEGLVWPAEGGTTPGMPASMCWATGWTGARTNLRPSSRRREPRENRS